MLLREVLSDTHQPSSVEAADQQEHCSLSLKSGRAEVCGNFDIKSRAVVRWNKFRQIFISYPSCNQRIPVQLPFRRKTSGFQFITVESFISGL